MISIVLLILASTRPTKKSPIAMMGLLLTDWRSVKDKVSVLDIDLDRVARRIPS